MLSGTWTFSPEADLVLHFEDGDCPVSGRTSLRSFSRRIVAAPGRFERPFTDPKSAVLPLDDGAEDPRHEARRSVPAGQKNGAEDGTRTRDPHLGKVMLYQLSHFRPFQVRCALHKVVPRVRIELTTPASSGRCSTN